MQRQDRLRCAALDDAEHGERDHGQRGQAEDLRRGPVVLVAAPGGDQHERGDADREQHGAEPVDAVLGAVARQVHPGGQDHQGQAAERQVDVERPAPRQVVGDEAADQRAGDHRDRHDAGDHALVAAPLAGRHQVTDDRHDADHQAAGAEALHGPERDELDHAVAGTAEHRGAGHSAERGADQEDNDRRKEDGLAAVEVTELAPDRRRNGRAEHVGGDHPGEVVEASELADDARQRRADDHVVEHREHHRDHQTGEDAADLLWCDGLWRDGGHWVRPPA